MVFPFKWVREKKWHDTPGQVIALEMNPNHILPAISVQSAWNKSLGIIRGMKEHGVLVEDHIREKLTEHGIEEVAEKIVSADEMRQDVWTIEQHKKHFIHHHPHERIVTWVGNGNLLSNPHFVGFIRGKIYHLRSEENAFFTSQYPSFVIRKPSYKKRVSIETLVYKKINHDTRVFSQNGNDITEEIEYATFGQGLVWKGECLDLKQLTEMAGEQQFYDLRHLFLFGRILMGNKRWLDAGLSAFWHKGKMNREHVKNALQGNPISVRVDQFDENDVREAMGNKGYDEVREPQQRGEFSLSHNTLKVCLLEGIYPHNMIGIKENGIVLSVAMKGLSNRVGVTIQGAARIMKMLGAKDALLIDNGGDVMMNYFGDQILGSAEGERNRLRSVIFFCQIETDKALTPNDLKLIMYPKQYCNQ